MGIKLDEKDADDERVFVDVESLGYFLGKLAKGEEKDELINLKKGFEKFFAEIGEHVDFKFQASIEKGKLITKSKCPIYRYYNRWCDRYCLKFVKGFVKAFDKNISIRRTSRQPESEYCTFEFETFDEPQNNK